MQSAGGPTNWKIGLASRNFFHKNISKFITRHSAVTLIHTYALKIESQEFDTYLGMDLLKFQVNLKPIL